ncbi:MAG: carboxypeptidase-like regulatory domain-containing protein [Prolixibacteraceae bacterium]|jgi:hypothetical protein|nr:carboxypeptidase-like regulatory domain-containing protein [Prolixibacteraceae bacterium]
MKQIVLTATLILFVLAGFTKNEQKKTEATATNELAVVDLSGTVTDEKTGELLVGVEVCLKGTRQKTYTDFDGKFSFRNVKKGDYDIVSNYISYQKQLTENVKVDQTKNQLEIKLQASN